MICVCVRVIQLICFARGEISKGVQGGGLGGAREPFAALPRSSTYGVSGSA